MDKKYMLSMVLASSMIVAGCSSAPLSGSGLAETTAAQTAGSPPDVPPDSQDAEQAAEGSGLALPSAPPSKIDPRAKATVRDIELFYEVLLGELASAQNDAVTGYALLRDAAIKTRNEHLFRRAVDVAMRARAGEDALQAVHAWLQNYPDSVEANRYLLQIMVALNRVQDTQEPLRRLWEHALRAGEQSQFYMAVVHLYASVTDKQAAADVVHEVLKEEIISASPARNLPALGVLGRMYFIGADYENTLDIARHMQMVDAHDETAPILAMAVLEKQPEAMAEQAEPIIRAYYENVKQPVPEMRMAYARVLVVLQRVDEAVEQLEHLLREHPDNEEAWLALGALYMQEEQGEKAQAILLRYLRMVGEGRKASVPEKSGRAAAAGAEPRPQTEGEVQAYLALAQIAEDRQDFDAAQKWMDRIRNGDKRFGVQMRRASLLARDGKEAQALALVRAVPALTESQQRIKLLTESSLLRFAKDYQAAYALMTVATARYPDDMDLLYDQAMLAEKLGDYAGMERSLRFIIARQPDYYHAFNALGYTFAEQGKNLPEARLLLEKALSLKPGDPFIVDSMGWLEYRSGNLEEAEKWLRQAFAARQDAEIAAHLGEVLWRKGAHDEARKVWAQGLEQDGDSAVLQDTIQRLDAVQ